MVDLNTTSSSAPQGVASIVANQKSNDKKKRVKKSANSQQLPLDIQAKAAISVMDQSSGDLANKITEMKKQQEREKQKKGGGSFAATYSETRVREIELQKVRFDWEKENAEVNRKASMQKDIILSCIQSGKNPEEVAAYLTLVDNLMAKK